MNFWYSLNLFVASLTVMIVTALAWRRRDVPGGGALFALGVAMTIWTLAYAFYWFFSAPEIRLICFNLMYFGVITAPAAFLIFTIRYTNRHSWIRKRFLALLSIIPALTLIVIWTDPLHHLFYGGGLPGDLLARGGIAFWVNLVYTIALVLFGVALLLQAIFITARPLRSQLIVIIVGALVPIALGVASYRGTNLLPGMDLIPLGFVVSCVCIALALSRYHLLDLIPVARSEIVDNLGDGCLVLDAQNRILDANRAAQKMLSRRRDELVGKAAEEVFQTFRDIYEQLRDTQTFHQEILVPTEPPSYYDIHLTPLLDPRGGTSGRLVTFRNVTESKKTIQAERDQRILAEALRDSAAALSQCRTVEEVLDHILDSAGRVVPFDLATILLAEEKGRARLVRTRGYEEHGLLDPLHQVDFSYKNLPILREMAETGLSMVIPDTSRDENWKVLTGLETLHSYVAAPIRIRSFVVGFLELISTTPGFFTREHADRLQTFADQAGIAIENARLLEQAQQRAAELSSLLEIGMAATSGIEMDKLLAALLEKLKRVLPIEALYVATYDNETGIIRYPLFYDRGERIDVPAHHISDSPGLTGYVIQSRQLLHLEDTFSEETLQKYHMVQLGGEPTGSYVGVPLLVGDQVVGAISMQSSKSHAYHPAQIRLLETIATQTAGAIENARLYEEIRQHAEEMTALFDIGIAITSGLEMEQVLKALLEKCKQVLPVEAFYTGILDPDTYILTHPLAYDNGEYLQIPPRNLRENLGLSGYIINTRQTLYIPDITVPDTSYPVQFYHTSGTPTRSYVGVPMIVGDRVVGIISMQSYQPDAYDLPQIRLLETIASQAAIAIENSRLYAKAQQELAERKKAELRYRALFEQSHDAVFIIGFDGRHLEVNRRATEMLGYTHHELCNMYVKDVSAEPDASGDVLQRLLQGEHIPLYERKFRRKNGKVIYVEINVELVRDENGTPLHIQSVVREITERKESQQVQEKTNEKLRQQLVKIHELQVKMRELAIRDPLTGLFNRRFLEETLEREFALARRQGTTVCLVMMDIDGFKAFNDTYGHDAGDFLLKKLGELLHDEIRRSDISCRFGGEEFLLVMPGVSLEKGKERADRLRRAFSAGKYQYNQVPLEATLSIGVAIYPDHGATWQKVLKAADRAMYAAKDAGRNKVVSAGD